MRSTVSTIFLAALGSTLCSVAAEAQVQRSFINLGFEEPRLNPNAAECPNAIWAFSTVMPANDVPGWRSTHPAMQGWCTNNGGTTAWQNHNGAAPLIDIWKSEKVANVPSRSGLQHAELNALVASRIYQTVCLLPNDQISWRFSHRARGDTTGAGPGKDKMAFKINNPNGSDRLTIAEAQSDANGNGAVTYCMSSSAPGAVCNAPTTYTVPGSTNVQARNWVDYSGSFTWTDAAGAYQFGFQALESSSSLLDEGNLIDDIQLDGLKPFVELSSTTYSSAEGTVDDVAILFSGLVEGSPLVVQVEVIPGSATANTDFTPSGIINIPIAPNPNGYAGEKFSFANQLDTVLDSLLEGPETFTLRIRESGSYLIENTRVCGAGGAYREATYTILDAYYTVSKTGTHVDLNGNGKKDAGDRIDYTIRLTNNGGVNLTNITVNDELLGGIIINNPGPLAPGSFLQHSGSYTIQQSDMQAGKVTNTAIANVRSPGGPLGQKSASNELTLDIDPGLDFVKAARSPSFNDANGNGRIDAGEQVPFNFTITNIGNVNATILSITDDLPGFTFQGLSLPVTLSPDEQITFSGIHIATQQEIDAGRVVNSALANYAAVGRPGQVRSHAPAGGSTIVTFPEPPADVLLELTKQVYSLDFGPDAVPNADDTISYRIIVRNTGNLTLHDLTVTDAKLGVNQSFAQLAPGQTRTIGPIAYVLSQAEVDAGEITNTATVTAQTPAGTPLSKTASVTQDLGAAPAVDVLKVATFVNLVGSELPEVGDRIDYTFTVTNTGNVTISNYTITDDRAEMVGGTPPPLPPGGVNATTFRGSHVITQADVDAGVVENVAILSGTAINGDPVTATSHGPEGGATRIALQQNAAVQASLAGAWRDANGDGFANVGEVVDFTITVTNTGNVVLTPVDLAGLLPTAGVPSGMEGLQLAIAEQLTSLSPSQSATVTYPYLLTQEDIDRGAIYAQVEVRGTGPACMQPDSMVSVRSYDPAVQSSLDTDGDGMPDYPTEVKLPQSVKLQVEKTGRFIDEGALRAGSRILYEIVITNTGTVTVNDVHPLEQGMTIGGRAATGILEPFTPDPVTLAPGESSTVFQAVYTVTEADVTIALANVEAGVRNVASATGTTRTGASPDVTPGEAQVEIPFLSLKKSAAGETVLRGHVVPYTLEIVAPEGYGAAVVKVRDLLPKGFLYQTGSALMNGEAVAVEDSGGTLIFHDIQVAPDAPARITYNVRVGSSVKPGRYTNRALVIDPETERKLSNEATATVEVASEAMFDCATVLGSVFDDRNRNGYRDDGEPGIPGSVITDPVGLRITTDAHGRFNIPCASRTVARIGSGYLLKLDPRSLPTGYRIITENPRHVRLLAGTVSTVDFGVSIGRVVRIEVSDEAFLPGTTSLRPEWAERLKKAIRLLEAEPSILRMVYRYGPSDAGLVRARIAWLRKLAEAEWKKPADAV